MYRRGAAGKHESEEAYPGGAPHSVGEVVPGADNQSLQERVPSALWRPTAGLGGKGAVTAAGGGCRV